MNTEVIRNITLVGIVMALGLASLGCSEDQPALAGLKNLKAPAAGYLSGGQPDAAQLVALADAGVIHVINLRPSSELPDFDEAQFAAAAGLQYHSLPVDGAAGLTEANVRALDKLMLEAGTEKVFLHCASGNRVGAMLALRAAMLHGADKKAAMAIGKAWGLTSLEPEVRRLLTGYYREGARSKSPDGD